MKPSTIWLGMLSVVLVAAIGTVFIRGNQQPEPGKAFVFNVDEYEAVDPALIKFNQTSQITLDFLPTAMTIDHNDALYITGDGCVALFDLDGTERARYVIHGMPSCVAVAPDGVILLGMGDHVSELMDNGIPKANWPSLGEKAITTAIVADEANVYVADAGNRVVWRMDRQGNVLNRIGEKDDTLGVSGFVIPSPYFDVALDPDGALWAVNPGQHGLEQYRPNGEPTMSWYRTSMGMDGFCGCCNPIHIAFLSDGSVITAEKGLARIKQFNADTTFNCLVASGETLQDNPEGADNCTIDTPIKDLAVDSADRVYVLDGANKAVRVFERKQ